MNRKSARDVPKRVRAAYDAIAQGAPELLDDLDISRMKAKPRAKPVQHERKDQGRGVIYLRRHLPRGSLVYAITNHARSKAQVFALMRDGMLPGMPDLGIIVPWAEPFYHRTFRIEWKRSKDTGSAGRRSPAQIYVHEMLRALGVPLLEECRSVEQAVAWLREQGVEI